MINLTFAQRRRLMAWMMLRHMLLGHPLSAVLARLNCPGAANWIHWRTLPARGRRKATLEQLHFDMHRSLFWADFFFVPLCHLIACFGYYYLAHRVFMFGPAEAVIKHSTHTNFVTWGRLSDQEADVQLAKERMVIFKRNRERFRTAREKTLADDSFGGWPGVLR